MKLETIQQLQHQFEALGQRIPDTDVEFWFARDLMGPLGYSRWENFQTVLKRAIESCKSTGYEPDDHFRGATKMVKLGSGSEHVKKLETCLKTDARNLVKQSGKLTALIEES